jgi:hypothetical protein
VGAKRTFCRALEAHVEFLPELLLDGDASAIRKLEYTLKVSISVIVQEELEVKCHTVVVY